MRTSTAAFNTPVDDTGTNCDEVTAPFAHGNRPPLDIPHRRIAGDCGERMALRSGIKMCTEEPVIAHEEMRLGRVPKRRHADSCHDSDAERPVRGGV